MLCFAVKTPSMTIRFEIVIIMRFLNPFAFLTFDKSTGHQAVERQRCKRLTLRAEPRSLSHPTVCDRGTVKSVKFPTRFPTFLLTLLDCLSVRLFYRIKGFLF